jgi:hypothetical protein
MAMALANSTAHQSADTKESAAPANQAVTTAVAGSLVNRATTTLVST